MKPSHYADKMPIMELEKIKENGAKTTKSSSKNQAKAAEPGRAGVVLREAHLRRLVGIGFSDGPADCGRLGGDHEHDSVDLLRSNELQTKLHFLSYFLSFFFWPGSSLSQFGAAASKPGAFNERMCSVMASAALQPRCDALSGCSIWPPGLSTHKTSADTSGENEMAQIKAAPAQPASRGTARL